MLEGTVVEVSQLRGAGELTRRFVLTRVTADQYADVWCWECSGTGDWPFHPSGIVEVCIPCRGTGRVWVSLL